MHTKKIFCIIIFSFFNVFALAPSFAPVNPEYRELHFPKSIVSLPYIWNDRHKTSFVPPPLYLPHLKNQRPLNIYIPLSFDEQFDLRDYNRDTPVKNQGACGSCWTFSSMSSLESALHREGVMDFSENNLNNRHGFDIPRCEGGNYHMSTAYFTRMSGPVEEHLDPYISTTSPSDIPPARFVTNIRFINKDMIKHAIVESGGVATTMYWNSQFYNSSESSYYCGSSYTPNHGVTIVGWDDNYSRYNFSQNPPGNGAWIVKNSWGKSWGENGYFYISYYDAASVSYNVVFEKSMLPDSISNVYQYDPLGWVSSMGYGNETAFMANVFTARKDEILKSVGFYTGSHNSSCEIQIHIEPDSGPLFSGGAEFIKSVTIPYAGYHVINLEENISLEAGTNFSVVLKINTPSYKYPIPVERPRSGYSSSANAGNGESFISPDGQSWQDLNKHSSNTNVCVKAFTVDKPSNILSINFPGDGSGKVENLDGSVKCLESCTLSVEPGSSFTFDAEAEESSIFQGWEGSDCEGTESCSIIVDSDTEISAEFTLKQYSVSISGIGNGTLTPEGEIILKHGENLHIEINPDEGYFVENVTVDGNSLGDSVYDYVFSDITGDHTLTAYFADSEGKCYTPSDFYERSYNSYLNYSFYGPINEYNVEFKSGEGDFTARIRGENTDVSSLSRRAEYYPLDDIISVRTIGVENSEIGLINISNSFFDMEDLLGMQESESFFLPAKDYTGVILSRAIIDTENMKMKKMCHTAFSTDGDFIICHGENKTFLPGESLDVRGSVNLYDDETGVEATFDNLEPDFCTCFDENESIPCPEDECLHGKLETVSCGKNNNGISYRKCFYGMWSDSSSCDDPDHCINGNSETSGACGLNDNGFLKRSCIDGKWNKWYCDDPDECRNETYETRSCGFNDNGSQQRECKNGTWSSWSDCEDPDECRNGARDSLEDSCGLNGNGDLLIVCINGKWAKTDECDDPDNCKNGNEEQRECGLNNRGTQERICLSGQWYSWSECDDPDECTDGREKTRSCGINNNGLEIRKCINGFWSEWSECVDDDVCKNGNFEERSCGLNENGTETRECKNGHWEKWEDCNDPDECVNDSLMSENCGLNNRGSISYSCVEGTWLADSPCDDPDVCVDGSGMKEENVCGLNGNGDRFYLCSEGSWIVSVECSDSDVCVNKTEESRECGYNNRGEQFRLCKNGQWENWDKCDDPDECKDESEKSEKCGLNDRGTKKFNCTLGKWEESGECHDPDICVDGNTEIRSCGLNNRGDEKRICKTGQWSYWSSCSDPDVCEDEAEKEGECGLNSNGTYISTCIEGSWNNSECNDPDVCVNGSEKTKKCGINDRGVRISTCTEGTWSEFGNCNDPDECEDYSEKITSCGYNNRGTSIKTCVTGQWSGWSSCEDPDECEDDSSQTDSCGINNRGLISMLCKNGSWIYSGECDDPDVCIDGTKRTKSCGINERGTSESLCKTGKWEEWSSCSDPDECVDNTEETAECGYNGNGISTRSCEKGSWSSWSKCNDPDECRNSKTEEKSCGLNGNGKQFRTCENGSWTTWGICDDPDECTDGSSEILGECGLNNNGVFEKTCSGGQWSEPTCSDPDICVNGDKEAKSCGLNDNGISYRECTEGSWSNWSKCVDDDICKDGNIETKECGMNDNGTMERICSEGEWEDWSLCKDPDECIDGSSEKGESCGLNNNGVMYRNCSNGSWGKWYCNDPDKCADNSSEEKSCGLNNNGIKTRICSEGNWGKWSECDDPDICTNKTVETQSCGINDNGTKNRICVEGNWNEWSECQDSDSCVNGEIQERPCGINKAGTEKRLCVEGVWSTWSSCEIPEEKNREPSTGCGPDIVY